MLFGVASQSITPPVGVYLWGYIPRPSTWIEHPLRAEALACESGNSGWILLCADVGAFSDPLARLIRADVATATGLPPEAVMITATHTHSGPHVTDAIWNERAPLESAYFKTLHQTLIALATTAWKNRSPGELLHARTTATNVGSNRRAQREDGTWTNIWQDPEGRNTGYCDPTVELLAVRRSNGELDALLVNFGCHPVCYNMDNQGISGDYVSYLKDALEAQGAAKTVMFTVSGHANVDPRECVRNDAAVTRRVGETIAKYVSSALPNLSPIGGGAAAAQEPWTLTTDWSLDERSSLYFPHANAGSTVNTTISCIAVGDCALLGMPGEAVSEYRDKFCKISPFGITLLVSLANDFVGYLPTDAILAEGAYEAQLCPCRPIEQTLTEHVRRALAQARRNQA